jgi:hypothetical protein
VTAGVAEPVAVPAPRERGWASVVVATLAFLVVPLTPLLRVLLPIEQTALLLAPALAGLAVAGWLAGGRAALAVVWVGVAAWSVWQLSGGGLFSLLQAGWALVVAAAMGALVAWRRDPSVAFLARALRAVTAGFALAAVAVAVVPGGASRVVNAVAAESGRRAEASRVGWRQMTGLPEWKEFVAQNPAAGEMSDLVERQLAALPAAARLLFPSLAALEALVAFALAWAVYHRLARARVGPPLSPVREFRFNDQLVWGVVAGLGLVVVPGVTALRMIGANLLLFFGALYTIRGVGVFMWMASPGRLATAALVVLGLLFWNVLGVMALGLGVGDTWFDWRARVRQKT